MWGVGCSVRGVGYSVWGVRAWGGMRVGCGVECGCMCGVTYVECVLCDSQPVVQLAHSQDTPASSWHR